MNKIQLIDAETLYYKPLAHPRMLIDGILADGLAVMAGDSKIGKSWMALWLCLQISKGEPVWGIPTRKTDMVYLALEDREWRIQQRMQELTETPPENLHFGFSCGQLGSELEGQIEAVLQDYPSTGLIFIDTLQMMNDREVNPEKYIAPKNWYKYGGEIVRPYKIRIQPPCAKDEKKLRRYYESKLAALPDVMDVAAAVDFTGYNRRTVCQWIRVGKLKALSLLQKYMIPKCYLIDWLCSDDYNNTNRKSRRHIDMLWEAQKWRD